MKIMWMKTLALAATAAAYSHAIFGIGGQWAPALGLEVKEGKGNIAAAGADSISIDQASVSGLNGFGMKLWIDALPFVDLEASSNIQYGFYDVSIISPPNSTRKDLTFDLGVPGVDKPAFARIMSDVTVLYPFLKLPPVVSLVKVYAGAGITHVLATEVLNAKFAKKAVSKVTSGGGGAAAADTPEEVSAILVDAIEDEGLKSGVGFHLELGAKAKPPVIPLAVFANFKYHFLSTMPSAVDGNSLTLELGGALAF
ncbi:MAG TPA: hypothetical protein VJ385_17350 [Fibrobacteria bacterium]|nr:hypothetical protein [Fibrobacteria bacterium]